MKSWSDLVCIFAPLLLLQSRRLADAVIVDGDWMIQSYAAMNIKQDGSNNILHRDKDVTIEKAREWCIAHEDCVAISFPPKSHKSMLTADHMFYVSDVEEGEHLQFLMPQDIDYEYVTHVLYDRAKKEIPWTPMPDEENIDYEYDPEDFPYSHCCRDPMDLNPYNENNEWKPSEEFEEYEDWVDVNDRMPTAEQIKEVENIERISCDISREEFVEKYESKRVPVVLEGCTDDWPGKEVWQEFKTVFEIFDDDSMWLACTLDEIPWSDVKRDDPYNTDEHVCIFDTIVGERGERFRQNYTAPRPFRDADFFRHVIDPKKEHEYFSQYPMAYFSLSSRFCGSVAHHDCHLPSTDFWNTLVNGNKWWILYPNTNMLSNRMAVTCDEECSKEDEHVSDWFVDVAFNAHKYVYEDGQRPIHVLQGPGDTVYLPERWMHALLPLDDCIAITEGYASAESNLPHVWKQLLAWGEESDWEKVYYEVLTDEQRKVVREAVKSEEICMPNSGEGSLGVVMKCQNSSFYSKIVNNSETCTETETCD